jgi:glycosidase
MPWLPLNADHAAVNVATLTAEPKSMLSLYRRLLALRRGLAALHSGTYVESHVEGDVLAFERRHDADRRVLVALNFGRLPQRLMLSHDAPGARLLLSTELDRQGEAVHAAIDLRPEEGVILELLPHE